MPCLTAVLAGVFLLPATLLAGCLGGDEDDAPVEPTGQTTDGRQPAVLLNWSASDYEGDLAGHLEVGPAPEPGGSCAFEWSLAGTFPGFGMWMNVSGPSASDGYIAYGPNTQAHVLGTRTDDLDVGQGRWHLADRPTVDDAQPLEITFAAFDLASWETDDGDTHPALKMTLTCAHPRTVILHTGSQETASFLSDTLAGGIGVSIGAPGAPTANHGDGVGLEATHPLVTARVGEDLRRNGQTGTTAGNLTLQTPNQTLEHTFTSGVMEPLRAEGGVDVLPDLGSPAGLARTHAPRGRLWIRRPLPSG